VLSGDLGDADVTIWTNLGFGIDPLLTESQKIAARLGKPETDFIVYRGRKTTHGVDLEFNDYLQKTGRASSSFVLNLADLRDALEASSLPRPITIFESHELSDVTVATLEVPGTAPRRASETFFALHDIPDGATLRYETTVPWYGYAVLFTVAGMFAVMFPYGEWTAFHARRRARERLRTEGDAVETVPDPAAVQESYNKQKPVWVYTLLIPGLMFLAAVGVAFSGRFATGVTAAFAALESLDIPMWGILLVPGVVGLTRLIGYLADKAQIKREGETPSQSPVSEDAPPSWTFVAFMYPMMGAMLAMSAVLMFPAFKGALLDRSPNALWYYLGAVAVLTVSASILVGRYARRFTHYALPEGHPAHAMIEELTRDAKVRVRNVEVVRSTSLNAYVSGLANRSGFTESAPARVYAGGATGRGRARSRTLPRRRPAPAPPVRLITSAALIGAWIAGTNWVEAHYTLSREAKALLNSPMFSIVLLPVLQNLFLGKARRRAEEAADRFAVDEMRDDGEFVIQTLTKLHTRNASPHQLKPSDEMLSSHPSLVNRIAAIRRYVVGNTDREAGPT
jgi:Zn-dependent protease with chaperone function